MDAATQFKTVQPFFPILYWSAHLVCGRSAETRWLQGHRFGLTDLTGIWSMVLFFYCRPLRTHWYLLALSPIRNLLTVIIASSRGRKLIIIRGVSIFAPFSLFAPSWVSASVPWRFPSYPRVVFLWLPGNELVTLRLFQTVCNVNLPITDYSACGLG